MLRLLNRMSVPAMVAALLLGGGLLHPEAAAAQVDPGLSVSPPLPGTGNVTTFSDRPMHLRLVASGGGTGGDITSAQTAIQFSSDWDGILRFTFRGNEVADSIRFSGTIWHVNPGDDGAAHDVASSFSFVIDTAVNYQSGQQVFGVAGHSPHWDDYYVTMTYDKTADLQITRYSFDIRAIHAVAPEPATWVFVGAGVLPFLGTAIVRRRRKE